MATRPLYSTLFYSENPAAAGLNKVGGPDPSHRWVIRDIDAINSSVWSSACSGMYVGVDDGAYIYWLTDPDVIGGRQYHWEGRSIIDYPQQLQVLAGDSQWSIRVSGYTLTLP